MWELIPNYDHYTFSVVFQFVLAGIFAALIRISWLNKPLRGFYRDDKGHIHMGFFAELCMGVGVALIINHHPINGLLAAIFAPFILDLIRNIIVSNVFLNALLKTTTKTDINKKEE